jgi:predicted 2-oxoglutarate/Fe(II)-dependent dioxygenase YbiX
MASSFVSLDKDHAQNRDGKTVHISEIDELKELDIELTKLFSEIQTNILSHRYKVNRKTGDTGYEYHTYYPGDICHVHGDGEISGLQNNKPSLLRYASVVLHLNTIDQGGELVFPAQNQKIKTEAGKIVIFPPYHMFQHYTTPSTETREVVVTWFVYSGINVYEN